MVSLIFLRQIIVLPKKLICTTRTQLFEGYCFLAKYLDPVWVRAQVDCHWSHLTGVWETSCFDRTIGSGFNGVFYSCCNCRKHSWNNFQEYRRNDSDLRSIVSSPISHMFTKVQQPEQFQEPSGRDWGDVIPVHVDGT